MSDSLEGIYEPLSEDHQAKVAELRKLVEGVEVPKSYSDWLSHHPTLFMARFLQARKWKVEDALTMYKESAAWRIAEGFETKPFFPSVIDVKGYDMEELKEIQGCGTRPTDQFVDKAAGQLAAVYAGSWHKWDKEGRPVFIERTGGIKVKELVKRCQQIMPPGESLEPAVAEPHKQSNELARLLLDYQNRRLQKDGKFAGQISVIMDGNGVSLKTFYAPALELLKANTTMDQKYYPEGMHKVYCVNAPAIVRVGWAIVKMWLDPGVQKKVCFAAPGEPTKKLLLEAFNEEDLPEFLGGKCCCKGGCVQEFAAGTPADEDEEATVEVKVPARNQKPHVVAVQGGQEIAWNWTVAGGNDVEFSVYYKAVAEATPVTATEGKAAANGTQVVAPARVKEGSGKYTAPADGVVTLLFDNSYSWMKSKKLQVQVTHQQQATKTA